MMTMHLIVTSLCDRNCEYCCNKKYDIHNLQYATDEDFKKCSVLCLTGGEPFKYANPNELARYYKKRYKNLKKVIVYTNAMELNEYLYRDGSLDYIDGLSISIKNCADYCSFLNIMRSYSVTSLPSNRLYDFLGLQDEDECIKFGFDYIKREWQTDFKPAENCIFRRGN